MTEPNRKDEERERRIKEGMAKLMALLDPDPKRAASKFVALKQRLMKILECNGSEDPATIFDRMIEQIVARLENTLEIEKDLIAYLLGAVKKTRLAAERDRATREKKNKQIAIEIESSRPLNPEEEAIEREQTQLMRSCFDTCRDKLNPDERFILENYHLIEDDKISQRERLRNLLKITAGALRLRAMKVIEKFAACIAPCLQSYGISLK